MTSAPAAYARMSPTEYLAWEETQREKHQYLGGEVYAMAGGTPRHNRLSANVLRDLGVALRNGPCGPFTSDQKVYVPATGDFVYPDGSVVCGPTVLHAGTKDVIENPSVIIEVLSKSTEPHDRGDKWKDYQSIPSLTDYVLVSQRLPRLEHYRRDGDGSWRYRAVTAGDRVELTCGAVLVVDDLFADAFDVPGED